jgi:hypothetical protein
MGTLARGKNWHANRQFVSKMAGIGIQLGNLYPDTRQYWANVSGHSTIGNKCVWLLAANRHAIFRIGIDRPKCIRIGLIYSDTQNGYMGQLKCMWIGLIYSNTQNGYLDWPKCTWIGQNSVDWPNTSKSDRHRPSISERIKINIFG